MKRITLNVDDLGLAPAVNQAVLRLAEMGRIQAASLMSLGCLPADEAAALQRYGVDLGLHLDFTGLAGLGCLKTVMRRCWLRQWSPALLRDTIARQLDAFEHLTGRMPVFVDGHQHVHQFPQIREHLVAELLRRYGAHVALRRTRPLRGDAKSRLIYWLGGPTLAQIAHSQGLAMNRFFGGVYAFHDDEAALAARWRRWLAAAPETGTLLMCHPAVPGPAWQDEILSARQREWHWLSGNGFAELWQQYGCCGQTWAQMLFARHG